MGDVLLTYPVLSFFKSRYPDSEIDYLTKTEYRELFALNTDIDKVIYFDKKTDELNDFRKKIHSGNYDYIFDLHHNLRSIFFSLFNGTKRFALKKYSVQKFLLVKFKINLLKQTPSISMRYFLCLKKSGLFDQNDFNEYLKTYTLNINKSSTAFLHAKFPFLEDFTGIIGFCPSARHNTKILPAEKFINIGRKLTADKNRAVIFFGSADEFDYCERISNQISDNQCFNLAGKTGIFETSTLISECNLVVTNDTGLMHLSNLIGVPLIAVFGSTVKELGFFPKGDNAIIFENNGLKCRPCSHIGLNRCPKKHFKCMNEIDENKIIKKAEEILNQKNEQIP